MINALLVIFSPTLAWERILGAKRGVLYIFCTYLLPVLALTSVVEGFGLVHWGIWQSSFSRLKKYPAGEAFVLEALESAAYLVIVLGSAKLIKGLGETFHGRHTYTQTFTAVSYCLAPLLWLRLVDMLPHVSPWVGWVIGMFFALGLLYQALPRILQPDPPHAMGLYLMSCLVLVVISGLAQFFMAMLLAGKITRLEPLISSWAAKLPF